MIERKVSEHTGFNLHFLRIGVPFDLIAGSEFILRHHSLAPEHGDALLVKITVEYHRRAGLAVETALVLRSRGISIPDEAIFTGLRLVRWPGRFELLRRDPVFILDGSHNPQGMDATVDSIKLHFPGRKLWFLLGVMADKDVAGIARLLGPLAAGFAAVEPPNPRAMKPRALADLLREQTGVTAVPFDTIDEGAAWVVEQAGRDGVCAALGSLYFSGEVRAAVEKLA